MHHDMGILSSFFCPLLVGPGNKVKVKFIFFNITLRTSVINESSFFFKKTFIVVRNDNKI